ncbi:MAG: AAA family ATPase [Ferrovum sp. 34-44-207]|nr:MAG: AAA family ATPase [Ferrovum sp. 34-44-207]HQT82218.1 ATP-binding protein [Ferrovaceae bacterium]
MSNLTFYPRHIESRITEAMSDTPVVLLAGPRQSGKTTLVRQLSGSVGRYLTLDDELTLMSAKEDPVGMIRNLDCAVIDEVQRAPSLLLAIKKSVDEDRRPGRFLLTGSANLMALPTVADSLAGRMETLLLLPLSQSEIEGQSTNWLDSVFSEQIPKPYTKAVESDLVDRVLRGGYPEAISRTTERRRASWVRQYIDALILRDIRDVASIDKLDQLPRFLHALAQTAGQMCNYSELGGLCGLDSKTAAKYVSVFEQMYLLRRTEVWAHNRLKRIVKTSKLQFIDSGLLASLIGLTIEEVQHNRSRFGHVLESFVYGELLKATTTAESRYTLMYYRDTDKVEVDIVIENAAGQLVGVEVKASGTVKESDLKGLRKLSHLAGTQFKMGILLYNGDETLPLGDNIWAAPLATLWGK